MSRSIHSLVDRALTLVDKAGDDVSEAARQLLPSSERWQAALQGFLLIRPDPSLAITDLLQGSLQMASGLPPNASISCLRDANGWSPALRIAMFVVELLKCSNLFDSLSSEDQSRIIRQLILTTQLAKDIVDQPSANHVWLRETKGGAPGVEEDVHVFVVEAQDLIKEWLATEKYRGSITLALEDLHSRSNGLSASAFYHARGFAYLAEEVGEISGQSESSSDAVSAVLKDFRKDKGPFCPISIQAKGVLINGYRLGISNHIFPRRLPQSHVLLKSD